MSSETERETSPLPRRPGLALGRRGLSLLFGLVLLCPVLIVLVLALILPAAHDQPLAVTADLVTAQGQTTQLKITNVGPVPVRALRIELNGAFAYFPQAPLDPGQELDCSLDWFMKKTGTHFEPGKTEIRTIHISARLPGNQRAVFKQTLAQ